VTEERTLPKALRTVLLAVLTFIFIFPVLWTLASSVKPQDILFAQPPKFFFSPIGDNFSEVLSSTGGAVHGLVNSVIIAGFSTLLVVVIGTPAAYALARLRVGRRDDILLFVLASRMAPPVALIIPFFLIYKQFGLLETHIGLIIAYLTFNLSFYVWVLSIFIRDIPAEPESGAEVAGDGPWRAFPRLVLPNMRVSLVATSLLVLIFAWNEFAYALLLGGPATDTLPVVISRYITPSGIDFGGLTAVGTIALAPICVVVFLLHKQIIRGLSMGAVKG
jgi:multiple sugar transport system permease protein